VCSSGRFVIDGIDDAQDAERHVRATSPLGISACAHAIASLRRGMERRGPGMARLRNDRTQRWDGIPRALPSRSRTGFAIPPVRITIARSCDGKPRRRQAQHLQCNAKLSSAPRTATAFE